MYGGFQGVFNLVPMMPRDSKLSGDGTPASCRNSKTVFERPSCVDVDQFTVWQISNRNSFHITRKQADFVVKRCETISDNNSFKSLAFSPPFCLVPQSVRRIIIMIWTFQHVSPCSRTAKRVYFIKILFMQKLA